MTTKHAFRCPVYVKSAAPTTARPAPFSFSPHTTSTRARSRSHYNQASTYPPLTSRIAPFMYQDESESRKVNTSTTSSDCAKRPTGQSRAIDYRCIFCGSILTLGQCVQEPVVNGINSARTCARRKVRF